MGVHLIKNQKPHVYATCAKAPCIQVFVFGKIKKYMDNASDKNICDNMYT